MNVAQPQLPSELTALTNLRQALSRDESLSVFTAVNQDVRAITARAVSIIDAKLEKLEASEANFEKLALTDVLLMRSSVSAANCAESSWRRVKLSNMRASGLKLQASTLRDVTFEGCKLDLSNFRFSKLKNVLFKDCVLDEADFYNAELNNVWFQNCSLQKAEFSAAKCKAVDLRGSEISSLLGVEGLAGATIDSAQLVAISQLLAQSFKIHVSDK
jgi:uncharacterized protein YjbI with pentapeptide repeats